MLGIKVVGFIILNLSLALSQLLNDVGFFCGIDNCPNCMNLGETCSAYCCLGLGCNGNSCGSCTPQLGTCKPGKNTCCSGYKCSQDSTCMSCAPGANCTSDNDCTNAIGNGCENNYCNLYTEKCYKTTCHMPGAPCSGDNDCCPSLNCNPRVHKCEPPNGAGSYCSEASCSLGQICNPMTDTCSNCNEVFCTKDSHCQEFPGNKCTNFTCQNGKCADMNSTCSVSECNVTSDCCLGLGCDGNKCIDCLGDESTCDVANPCCPGFECMSRGKSGSFCV